MSDEASPRPWTFCPTYGEHRPNSIIADADGGNVALVCHFTNEEEENRIGRLIVDAVNERERLRDIVRRLSRHLANYITSESENDLLREARAAIGEDAR